MANNLEDVYIRIKLDAAGSQQEVLRLEEAFDKLQKKLKQYQDPDTKKIKDQYKKDPEVQNLVDQWRKVDTLVKQNRQWIQDITKEDDSFAERDQASQCRESAFGSEYPETY